MENNTLRPQDIPAIAKRRKRALIFPFVTIFFIASAIALLLPPIYKSSSTILIEDQEIPAEYIQTTVTSLVEKRLQEIKQKIMSTTRLQEIIDRYELYTDLKKNRTSEEIIDKMRDDIALELISAEVVDKRTGRNTNATVAFTLSYEGKNDPVKVQRVASVLASLYLDENIKVRERQVREASVFFEEEKNRIEQSIHGVETAISAFKEQHLNELPELIQMHLQDIHSTEINIERSMEQLRGFKEREAYLLAQIGQVSPQMADQEKLSLLKLELNRLTALYSEQYPDIVHLKKEIAEIERNQPGGSAREASSGGGKPTNPAFITLNSQLSSVRAEIASARQQMATYEGHINKLRGYIRAAPVVEQEYRKLLMERDSLKRKYDDLMQKLMEAQVAQGLEKGQKGERFTLIDPALLPEKPYKPNRLILFLIGIVLGMGCSIGLTVLLELSDDTIHDAVSFNTATRIPVLSVIPYIYNESERRVHKKRYAMAYGVGAAVLVLTPLLFHFLVMDLYIFWAKVMRNLNL